MSFSEQNIQTFIELLVQQRFLFSAEQLAELECLIDPLTDDVDILSEAISSWIEQQPAIQHRQDQLLDKIVFKTGEKSPGKGNIPKPNYELNKKMIRNAIQQGSVSEQSKPSKSK